MTCGASGFGGRKKNRSAGSHQQKDCPAGRVAGKDSDTLTGLARKKG
jgi:hypothetical protein